MVSYGEFREAGRDLSGACPQRPRTPPTARRPGCPFCLIVGGQAPATVLREWPETLAIRPRHGGVTAGRRGRQLMRSCTRR